MTTEGITFSRLHYKLREIYSRHSLRNTIKDDNRRTHVGRHNHSPSEAIIKEGIKGGDGSTEEVNIDVIGT